MKPAMAKLGTEHLCASFSRVNLQTHPCRIDDGSMVGLSLQSCWLGSVAPGTTAGGGCLHGARRVTEPYRDDHPTDRRVGCWFRVFLHVAMMGDINSEQ
jgi:hypothetical protein